MGNRQTQSKTQSDDRGPPRMQHESKQNPQEAEQLSILKNVYDKIGEYSRSILTKERCEAFRLTINQYRNAKYFNIRGHRDQMFQFYTNLLKYITDLYIRSNQAKESEPYNQNIEIGKKIVEILTQSKVQKIKYALKNYAHCEIKDFPEKILMFNALQQMMKLIGN